MRRSETGPLRFLALSEERRIATDVTQKKLISGTWVAGFARRKIELTAKRT